MKVAFSTLGCRVNQYETEAMAEKFIREGYEVVDFDNFADVYVINTCTVTNISDKKSRQMIGRARRLNENAVIAVVGCYSQVQPDKVSAIEGVDVVLGSRNKGDIVYWVNRSMADNKQIVQVNEVMKNKEFDNLKIEEYQNKTRAFLKIQDGCNRFCSYCLIPFARGGICSKKPDAIISEVIKLAAHGFKEIILSGIHIASYGLDLGKEYNLVSILEEINKVDGIERIRIGSIDPTFFSEGVIEKISSIEKLCPHFHLSLQSGCNETLNRMNRHYTTEQYKEIVENLRRAINGVSITTDIIVGFPGETESEFETTVNFLKDIKLSRMHIFKYSPREGTKAADMKEQVDGTVKDTRSNKLENLNKQLEADFMMKFKNGTMKVLYEENFNGNSDIYEGYTDNYIRVVAKSNVEVKDKIIATKLLEIEQGYIEGSISII